MPDNPFGQLLTGGQSGTDTFINRIFGPPIGVQTLAEQERLRRQGATELGGVRSKVAQRIQALRLQNPSASVGQLLVQLTGDKDFQEAFSFDPDIYDFATKTIQGMMPQPAETETVAPGSAVIQKGTGQEIYRNPTADVQTVQGLGDLAGMDDEQIAAVARITLLQKQNANSTQIERAIADYIAAGGQMDELTSAKLRMGGIYEVTPITNEQGETIGHQLTDKLSNTSIPLGEGRLPEQGGPAPQVPGSQPTVPGGLVPSGGPAPAPGQVQGATPQAPATALQTPSRFGGLSYVPGISAAESGGNYNAVGPKTRYGRAVGRYQMLPANVRSWSAELYGKPLSTREFLASPQKQDEIFDYKFGQYVQQYGTRGAVAKWFTGNENAPLTASDGYHTLAWYLEQFNRGMSGQAPTRGPRGGGVPHVGREVREPQMRGPQTFEQGGFSPAIGPFGAAGADTGDPLSGAEAAFSTGPVPAISESVGNILGAVNPERVNEEAVQQRTAMRQLREQYLQYYKTTGRTALQEQERILESFGGLKFWTNPLTNLTQLREIRRTVAEQVEADRAIAEDVQSQPKELRTKAQDGVNQGERLLRMIGTEDQLTASLAKARTLQKSGRLDVIIKQLSNLEGDVSLDASEGGRVEALLARVRKGEILKAEDVQGLSEAELQQILSALPAENE